MLSYNVVKDFAQNLKHPNILRVQQFCWGSFDWENCVIQTNTLLPVEMNFADLILWDTRKTCLEIFSGNICSAPPPSYWAWLTAVTDLYGKKCPRPQPRWDLMQIRQWLSGLDGHTYNNFIFSYGLAWNVLDSFKF